MTDRAPVTTLDAVHAAVLAAARARFGERIAHYGAYEPFDPDAEAPAREILTPALLLEVEDFAAADPDPLGRLGAVATLSLHCVLSVRTERLQERLPQFAAAVMALVNAAVSPIGYLRGNDWGLGGAAERPDNCQAQPAEFAPGWNGRDAWVVRWEQTFYLSTELPE